MLGALADSVGHLAAARILSLVFMLGATGFLYAIAKRLFGQGVAIVACGLWATAEPCLKLGAFATFDPLAVFLISMGTWLAIRAGQKRFHGELIALSAVALMAGALTAYSYLIYVPVVIAIAAVSWVPVYGRKRSLISAAWLMGVTVALFVCSVTVLKLWAGLTFTVLNRHVDILQGYRLVVDSTWSWQGIVMCLAAVGALVAIATSKQQRVLVVALALACLIVPLQQAGSRAAYPWISICRWGSGWRQWRPDTGSCLSSECRSPASCWSPAAVFSFYSRPSLVLRRRNGASRDGIIRTLWWRPSTSIRDNVQGQIAVENSDDAVLRYYTSQGRNWEAWAQKWTGIALKPVVGSVSAQQRAAGIAHYRQSLNAGNYGTVIVFFNQLDVYNLTQTTFSTAAQGAGSAYNQEVVRLLANNPELTAMVDALLEDPEYKVTTVVPYGRDLSGIGAAAVFWQRVPALNGRRLCTRRCPRRRCPRRPCLSRFSGEAPRDDGARHPFESAPVPPSRVAASEAALSRRSA